MPHPQPVEQIELSEKNVAIRFVAVAVLVFLGIATIGYALTSMLSSKSGWETIEVNNGSLGDVSKEFVFEYRLGAADLSPTAEKKALTLLYGELTRRCYQVFHEKETFDGVAGLANVNANPNQKVKIDKGLYQALQRCVKDGNRAIYYGPLYGTYDSLFYSQSDEEASSFDPERNQDLKDEIKTLVSYVTDPEMVDLKFLEDDCVELVVDPRYQTYLKENWEEPYLGFGWMKNAFIIDYMADELARQGYVNGVLVSNDGFIRNLYEGKETASYGVFHRDGNTIGRTGEIRYSGKRSMVFLRDYPITSTDFGFYYEYGDGTLRCPYVDPEDGMLKAATDGILAYSADASCGEIAMNLIKVFVKEELDSKGLVEFSDKGIYYLCYLDNKMITNDENLNFVAQE